MPSSRRCCSVTTSTRSSTARSCRIRRTRPIVPGMMGHDPLMQFVHEQDAAYALYRAVESRATGPLNIVGKGVLPYTTVLALLGRVPVPMPQLVARQLTKLLWATQLVG